MPRWLFVSRTASATAVAALLLNCGRGQTVSASQSVSPSATAHPNRISRPPEDEQAERGKNIPGFAGYTLGGRENLVVYLTDLKYAEKARAEFEPVLRARKPLPPNPWVRDPAAFVRRIIARSATR